MRRKESLEWKPKGQREELVREEKYVKHTLSRKLRVYLL